MRGILQHLQNINATISAKKFILATPDATIVGHKCTSEGRVPHKAKIQKSGIGQDARILRKFVGS